MTVLMSEEIFEHETEQTMSRETAAKRLREIADQLEKHNEVSVVSHGRDVTVRVADQVTFEYEVEVESADRNEIEITISW